MRQRAVVTGGAGFLGSHLCARLLDDGFDVVALDNLVTGRLSNIEPLLGHQRFRFRRHDVIDEFQIDADWIFNLACCASPRHYQRDPEKTVRTCTDGTLNGAETGLDCGGICAPCCTGADICSATSSF
jgi:UDP-glucuronate decarboxylase